MSTYFISGIDTDAGKTYCTAWLSDYFTALGKSVITQKFIQTGCKDTSEDIEAHRRLTGSGPMPEDAMGLTAPIIFTYPASAQLAARIDGCTIDLDIIDKARNELENRYDIVLVEGAGGLMVPITDDFFAIDYAVTRQLPVYLVTNSRLGSINHTMLSLKAIADSGLTLKGILYNTFYDNDPLIAEDTRGFIQRHVSHHFPDAEFHIVPTIKNS